MESFWCSDSGVCGGHPSACARAGGRNGRQSFHPIFVSYRFHLPDCTAHKSGQTLGKKALGIRIVKMNTGLNGGFVPNVLLRIILNGLIGVITFYGLVDILFIFRSDCRCIHDLIAGTQVVIA